MARTIHQLYCTHCTYGTSALHRHTGNVRTQPFEYSTRAGSVEQSLSHQTFQRFEKQYFRGIPMAADAPVDIRKRNASNAPWRRMVYSPSVDGLRLLANVCYRTTDTAGRLGSYFAHVLLEEERDGRGPWNPTDCLKLWGASFWQTVDRELADSAFVLKKLHELDISNCPGYGAIVNDQALTQFLTAPAITPSLRSGGRESPGNAPDLRSGGRKPPGNAPSLRSGGRESPGNNETATSSNNADSCPDVFPAPNHRQDAYATGTTNVDPCLDVFPARWREMKPEERRQLLTDLLHAVMELDLKNQERLTIAVEPGVAALLFYGIFRLLPPASVQHLSFSTFESHLERPATSLTAHDFADPKSTDLSPDAYRTNGTRGFTVNTYRSTTSFKFRHPTSKFAEMMVQAFVSGGGDAIDRLVGQLKAAGNLTREQLESLASVYRRLRGFLTNEISSEEFCQLARLEKEFAGQLLAGHLAAASDEAIKSLSNLPAYLSALDLISAIANDPLARQAEKRLVRVLPVKNDVRNAFFALPKLSVSLKVAWLKSYLKQKGQFPQNCPNLWFNDASPPSALLSDLLQQATPDLIAIWRQSVPQEFAWSFAAALVAAVQSDPAKRPMLTSVIEGLDDDGLCKLLDKPSGRAVSLLAVIGDDGGFQQRLTRLSDAIRTTTSDQVQARVEALLSLAPQLPFLKVSLNRWAGVRDAVKRCGACAVDPAGRPTRPLEIALCEVLKALGIAMSDIETQVSPIEIDVKLAESLLRHWWNPQRQDLLQASIRVIPAIQVAAADDTSLCAFLAGERGAAWRRSLPADDTSLQQRLRTILEQLPDNVATLPILVAGLTAARQWLGPDVAKLSTWENLTNMLVWLKRLRGGFDSPREMNGADVIKAAGDLAPLIYLAFGNRITCDASKKNTKKLGGTRCLENLGIATIGDNTLLESMFVVLAIEHEYERQASSKGSGMFAGLLKR